MPSVSSGVSISSGSIARACACATEGGDGMVLSRNAAGVGGLFRLLDTSTAYQRYRAKKKGLTPLPHYAPPACLKSYSTDVNMPFSLTISKSALSSNCLGLPVVTSHRLARLCDS